MMKHLNKYLSLALALVLCLSLAACGESNEDYGDDGSDYNLYGVPDSFEGLVKDSEQMSNLYLYRSNTPPSLQRRSPCGGLLQRKSSLASLF